MLLRNVIGTTLLALGLFVSAAAEPARAQGFLVEPMSLLANPSPRETIELPLTIHNSAVDGPRTIQLRLVTLSEDELGSWTLIEPGGQEPESSALAWTTLSEDSVSIAPQQPAQVTVAVTPPADARGAYFVGIVAETPVPEDSEGVVIQVRFLIPVVIQVRGRTVAERVSLSDVAMAYQPEAEGGATTSAYMAITNTGRTFSRVRGQLTIEWNDGAAWRVVTRVPVAERGIIPGVTLKLGGDLQRRLPSGTYRLRGELFVSGRRVTPLEKTIEFEGDPSVAVAYDATLVLQPGTVEMEVVPGATRTTILRIENTSDSPVDIDMSSRTPRGLAGVQMGDLRGTELSAEPWVTIRPSTFTLRPNGRQNVRVISSIPADGVDYPNYYADLVLKGTYPDGQSAGETFSTIHLDNERVDSDPAGQIEQVTISEGGQTSQYIAELRFVNISTVDFVPRVRVVLSTQQGGILATKVLSGEEGPLLPLGKRTFSGELDLSNLAPGQYVLMADVSLPEGGTVVRSYAITISGEQGTDNEGKQVFIPSLTLSDSISDEAAASIEPQEPVPADAGQQK